MSKKMNVCLDETFYCKMVESLLMTEAFSTCLIEDIQAGELNHIDKNVTSKLLDTFKAQVSTIQSLHKAIIATNVMNIEMEKAKN